MPHGFECLMTATQGASKSKAARRAEREAAAQERMRQRAALETGDERGLPARDKGPQKRWVRDYVDARTGIGEWLMPVVFAYVLLMFIPGREAGGAAEAPRRVRGRQERRAWRVLPV